MKKMMVRVMHAVQYERNPKTGEDLHFGESNIQAAISHKGVKRYAYIRHDKDHYTKADETKHINLLKKEYQAEYIRACQALGFPTSWTVDNPLDPTEKEKQDQVIHNKIGTQEDYIRKNQYIFEGALKPPHWHIVVEAPNKIDLVSFASWLGIPENDIYVPKGHGAFLDNVEYLDHSRESDKYIYAHEDVIANFDVQAELAEKEAKALQHEKYRKNADEINDLLQKVSREGMTLNQVRDILSDAVYIRNSRLFDKARKDYITNYMPMPSVREVFYIDCQGSSDDSSIGEGGMGKTVCTHALAKQMAREYGADITKRYDELGDYIYDSGDPKVALQNYDGQPILVLNEMSAYDMKQAFGGVNGVKELLDPFPTKQALNIKFGAVAVTAKYILINGIQTFEAFKKALAGGYTDKDGNEHPAEEKAMRQFDRRFWVNVHIVDSEYIDILFNKGIFDDTDEYSQYIALRNVRVNFKRMISRLQGAALATVETKVLAPVVDKLAEYEKEHSDENKICNVDDIAEEFFNYGEIVEPEISTPPDASVPEYEELSYMEYDTDYDLGLPF